MEQGEVVHYARDGEVAVITVDNPPVNALSAPVREGIIAALDRGNADPEVRALVLIGAGRSFIAGADIREFGKSRVRPPIGSRTYDRLDRSDKPVVAAIHGYALGGGLENALACHYRIAKASAKVGLPEVLIGILPGGGGTQRLPRLAGPKVALEMITSGRHVPAAEAKALGIIDEVLDDDADLRAEAVAYARRVAGVRPLRRVRDLDARLGEGTPELFEAMRKGIAKKARNQRAPYNCIAAVEAACTLPFDEGMQREQELFGELENAEESRALRYAFFAEREAAKIPGLDKSLQARAVKTAAVVGAGTMGGGIAMAFADAGIPVRLLESSAEALDRGMERIRANYATSVKRGSTTQAQMDERLTLISAASDYAAIGDCDAVVEAVFEELPVKQEVFKKLDAAMKKGALLLSNTSGIDIDAIAGATGRPGEVAGAHFFSPANVMKLLEVVNGSATDKAVLHSTMQLGRRLNKISAVAGNCDGFVANRSRAPFNSEMVILLEEGALPEQVDRVMVEFGYPMGPFAVADLAGLDISYAGRRRRAAANPNYRKLPIADALVEMGRHGQKTQAGWYRYEKGDRTPHPDELVSALIRETATKLGHEKRDFSDEEILQRLLFSSVNEACRILAEGRAYRASDIDVMWLSGFGFPRYRGGLMFWADGIGGAKVLETIKGWHARYGERWAPSPYLAELVAGGTNLRDAKGKMA